MVIKLSSKPGVCLSVSRETIVESFVDSSIVSGSPMIIEIELFSSTPSDVVAVLSGSEITPA